MYPPLAVASLRILLDDGCRTASYPYARYSPVCTEPRRAPGQTWLLSQPSETILDDLDEIGAVRAILLADQLADEAAVRPCRRRIPPVQDKVPRADVPAAPSAAQADISSARIRRFGPARVPGRPASARKTRAASPESSIRICESMSASMGSALTFAKERLTCGPVRRCVSCGRLFGSGRAPGLVMFRIPAAAAADGSRAGFRSRTLLCFGRPLPRRPSPAADPPARPKTSAASCRTYSRRRASAMPAIVPSAWRRARSLTSRSPPRSSASSLRKGM